MIGYTSRTGTRQNLDALRHAGWRLLVSARGPLRPEGFRYGLDNGFVRVLPRLDRARRQTDIEGWLAGKRS
jgi:hypothetical protein